VVRVPAAAKHATGSSSARSSKPPEHPSILALLLACGHVLVYLDEDIYASEASRWLFACDECGAEDQEVAEVLGDLSAVEVHQLDDDGVDRWFAALLASWAPTEA
jgi:hypothetical protein